MTAPPPVPPVDMELERALLGGALHSAEVARAVAAAPVECFHLEAHRAFHRALGQLVATLNGAPPASALVAATAAAHGEPLDPVLIAHADDAGLLVLDAAPYLERLRELAAQREEASVATLLHAYFTRGGADVTDGAVFREARARLARADTLRTGVPAAAAVLPLGVGGGTFIRQIDPPMEPLIESLLSVRWQRLGGGRGEARQVVLHAGRGARPGPRRARRRALPRAAESPRALHRGRGSAAAGPPPAARLPPRLRR